MAKQRLLQRDLVILSAAFFFIFLGPGSIQQHLDKVLGAKRFYVLATLYGSLCVWRVFVPLTIGRLGDLLSELLGAATYVAFSGVMLLSTSWPVAILAAAVWGWGAASMWITSQSQLLESTRRHGAASGLFYSVLTGGHALGVGVLALLAVCWDEPLSGVLPWLAGGRWGRPLADMVPWTLGQTIAGACALLGLPGLVLICLAPRPKIARRAFSLRAFWQIASRRPIVLVGVIQLCSSLSYGILLGVFSEIARTDASGQWPAIAFYVARVALCFPAGMLADKIGQDRVLKIGFLLAAGGILAAALWQSNPGASLSICAVAMATQTALTASNAMALMGGVAPSAERHMALGAVFLWSDLGVMIPLLLAGLLKGFLPEASDTRAVTEVFRHALLAFAGVFVLCAFVCNALRKAVAEAGQQEMGK